MLVTGGAGSIGGRLVERLVEASHPVRVFDLPSMDFSSFEGRDAIEIVRGDIADADAVASSVTDVSAVVHLAALLPPASERDRDLCMAVNVGGSEAIVKALIDASPGATLVFASSVSTYGDTSADRPLIGPGHAQRAVDIYAESKIAAEALVRASPLKTVVLRIAGIAVPAFLEPPRVWPFTPQQRVEMVHRDDVVDALSAAVGTPEAGGGVFNIAGGPTWRLRGRDYVTAFYDYLGAPVEEAVYRDSPGWLDWYDTEESQRTLKYQSRSYEHYAGEMRELVRSMLAE